MSLARDAQQIFRAAVSAVSPAALLAADELGALLPRPAHSYERVIVLGAGKAAMAMAGALERAAPRIQLVGEVVVPHGYPTTLPASERAPARLAVRTAGHPVPDAHSVAAADAALAAASGATANDLVIVLISGGGSALWAAPPAGVALRELQDVTRRLVASGAAIAEINTIRQHLSRIAAGRLARAAAPAALVTLAISDVVGDDPAVIASGPTVPSATTPADALRVLKDFDLLEAVAPSIRAALDRSAPPPAPRPEKPSRYHVVAANRTALDGAAEVARRLGYRVVRAVEPITGEARRAGTRLAHHVLAAPAGRVCYLAGGETTVTVAGSGSGGRNQEVALAAAIALDGAPTEAVVLSGGTDGVDGPTPAAGGWADTNTASRARGLNMEPLAYLDQNDSHTLLEAMAQTVRTGPTHTNVMDVTIGLSDTQR